MKSIDSLKKRLNEKNIMQVQHERGHIMDVVFQWNDGLLEEVIVNFEKKIGYSLPKEYVEFMKITNGATLFNV